MAIEGLYVKDTSGKVVVHYLDIAQIDLSALMTRLFDRVLGPDQVKRDNVIPISKGKEIER